MKAACLVLGYRAASVLSASASTVIAAGFDIYLHIDRKADQAEYIKNLGLAAELCSILEDPVEVFWGGFSMVRAELKLITAARKKSDYDKYLLISDDTFPVFPAHELAAHFDCPDDHITIRRQDTSSPFYARYQGFFCYDNAATTVRTPPPPNPRDAVRQIDVSLEEKIADIAFLRRVGKKRVSVFYGAQFWALTRETINLVLKVVKDDIHFVKSFEYSALPDEIFFHSLIGNFGGKDYIETAPVYADFSGGDPRIVSGTESLPLDLNQPHAFIRKFSPNAKEFLELCSRHLHAGRTIYGTEPNVPLSQMLLTDKNGIPIYKYRLCAPAEGLFADGWHGIEVGWGRKYRWTATSDIRWIVTLPDTDAKLVRFLISTAISGSRDWITGCKLKVGHETKPVCINGGELFADFGGLSAGEIVVKLSTPPVRAPAAGFHDKRHLGLAISV